MKCFRRSRKRASSLILYFPDWDVITLLQVVALSLWDHNTFQDDEFLGYSFVAFDDCYKDKDTEKVSISSLSP